MTYYPMLIFHIAGGMIAIVAGSISLLSRKGSRLHRSSGKVFVYSMMVMGLAGAYAAIKKSQPSNILAGVLSFYLVATAWLTVKRKAGQSGRMEVGLLFLAVAVIVTALIFAQTATKRADVIGYYSFMTIASLFAVSDVRLLIRGGVSGVQRMARHLWRMGFALFVAAGSFFLGTASKTGLRARLFTKEIRATHLPEIPVLIIIVLTLYWLIRVRFGSEYKAGGKKRQNVSATPAPVSASHVASGRAELT